MEIRRSVARDGNLVPTAWNLLCRLPPEALHHELHGILHPKSAYSTSLRAIFDQWFLVLEELDRLTSEYHFLGRDDRLTEVLSTYRVLLYRLNEHFDACYLVLRSLLPPGPGKNHPKHVEFLKARMPAGWRRFKDAIRPYKDERLGAAVNVMKHDQAQLRGLYFYGSREFRPGYFLCNVRPDGALGPVRGLHGEGNTAFSFSRDMLLHFWWVYRVGEILADTVIRSSNSIGEVEALPTPFDHDTWPSTIQRLGAMSPSFFPDEVKQPYPRLLCHKDLSRFSVGFPAPYPNRSFPKDIQVRTFLNIDMDQPVNKLPYFGSDTSR